MISFPIKTGCTGTHHSTSSSVYGQWWWKVRATFRTKHIISAHPSAAKLIQQCERADWAWSLRKCLFQLATLGGKKELKIHIIPLPKNTVKWLKLSLPSLSWYLLPTELCVVATTSGICRALCCLLVKNDLHLSGTYQTTLHERQNICSVMLVPTCSVAQEQASVRCNYELQLQWRSRDPVLHFPSAESQLNDLPLVLKWSEFCLGCICLKPCTGANMVSLKLSSTPSLLVPLMGLKHFFLKNLIEQGIIR